MGQGANAAQVGGANTVQRCSSLKATEWAPQLGAAAGGRPAMQLICTHEQQQSCCCCCCDPLLQQALQDCWAQFERKRQRQMRSPHSQLQQLLSASPAETVSWCGSQTPLAAAALK